MVYESLAPSDCEFIAQVLTAIDTRVNFWLEECTSKPASCNVNNEILNFDELLRIIKKDSFTFHSRLQSSVTYPNKQEPTITTTITAEMIGPPSAPQCTNIIMCLHGS